MSTRYRTIYKAIYTSAPDNYTLQIFDQPNSAWSRAPKHSDRMVNNALFQDEH